MKTSSVTALMAGHTGPYGQVLAVLEEMALCALQHDEACEDGVRATLVDLAPKLLTTLGYSPPEGAEFAGWWTELLHLLDRRAEAAGSGTRIGEETVDWDELIVEALTALCGEVSR